MGRENIFVDPLSVCYHVQLLDSVACETDWSLTECREVNFNVIIQGKDLFRREDFKGSFYFERPKN